MAVQITIPTQKPNHITVNITALFLYLVPAAAVRISRNTPLFFISEGVANIDDILRVSDGIMIARGDMGVEIPLEEVPIIQKKLIKNSNVEYILLHPEIRTAYSQYKSCHSSQKHIFLFCLYLHISFSFSQIQISYYMCSLGGYDFIRADTLIHMQGLLP